MDNDEEERARKRRKEEEEQAEQSRRAFNMCTGDMLNTGIPGGIDMNMTTPW